MTLMMTMNEANRAEAESPHRQCRCTSTSPTSANAFAAKRGMKVTLCRACLSRRFRHGSAVTQSIRPSALRPFLRLADAWRLAHSRDLPAAYAILELRRYLDEATWLDPSRDSTTARASAALAAWRDTGGLTAERMLSAYLAVAAYLCCVNGEPACDPSTEYRHAQIAHAVRRAAKARDEGPHGLALRLIGHRVDDACAALTREAVPEFLRAILRPA